MWIDIKKRMPENGVMVLLVIEIDYKPGFLYMAGCINNGRWMLNESNIVTDHQSYEYGDGSYEDSITHWMPLPSPPTADNVEGANLHHTSEQVQNAE